MTNGCTPVHVAAAGADLGLIENDRYDAVTIAAVADDEETLRVLLSLGASARRTTSRYAGTALIAAAHHGHDGVVRQLIAAKAILQLADRSGRTPLALARERGHAAMEKLLVKAGAH